MNRLHSIIERYKLARLRSQTRRVLEQEGLRHLDINFKWHCLGHPEDIDIAEISLTATDDQWGGLVVENSNDHPSTGHKLSVQDQMIILEWLLEEKEEKEEEHTPTVTCL